MKIILISFFSLITSLHAQNLIENLQFSDSEADVFNKLEANPRIKSTHRKTIFGSFGSNGMYKTKASIQGLHFSFHFSFSNNKKSVEQMSLLSDPQSSYTEKFKATWQESHNLLSAIYGKAAMVNSIPPKHKLNKGSHLCNNLWRLQNNRAAMLGVKLTNDGKYQIVILFLPKMPRMQQL